jgi:CRP-like cAMP-binding protein
MTVVEFLEQHCFTRDLPIPVREAVAQHSRLQEFPAGTWLFREGSPAQEFHLVVTGRVAVSMYAPGAGEQVVDTVEACETVGWSWLMPPYRWFFDARAVTDVTAVTVNAEALRALAEADPAVGYALLRQVNTVMLARLQAARVRLADMYGVAS